MPLTKKEQAAKAAVDKINATAAAPCALDEVGNAIIEAEIGVIETQTRMIQTRSRMDYIGARVAISTTMREKVTVALKGCKRGDMLRIPPEMRDFVETRCDFNKAILPPSAKQGYTTCVQK